MTSRLHSKRTSQRDSNTCTSLEVRILEKSKKCLYIRCRRNTRAKMSPVNNLGTRNQTTQPPSPSFLCTPRQNLQNFVGTYICGTNRVRLQSRPNKKNPLCRAGPSVRQKTMLSTLKQQKTVLPPSRAPLKRSPSTTTTKNGCVSKSRVRSREGAAAFPRHLGLATGDSGKHRPPLGAI